MFYHLMIFKIFSLRRSKKDGPTEYKKCLCKQKKCSWAQKSEKCPINEIVDSVVTSGNDLLVPTVDNSDSPNSLGLPGLRSIVREISLTNNGNIYFNLNLR